MKELINLVSKIHHVKKSDISSIVSSVNGKAIISYTSNFEVPISKSSARLRISSERSKAGVSFEVALSAKLIEEIKDLEPGIYLVTLENGDIYIVGTIDYPALYNSSEMLTEKSFEINYKSLEKPFKIA